jgi:hypothetical protein
MSFDFALSKGDITIGSDGDVTKVRNTSKLVQDILKVIHTPIGGNPFYPSLGTLLTADTIGSNISQQFAETKIAASVTQAIQIIQNIQRRQESIQIVTPEEKVVKILRLDVSQNAQEPRQYDIQISVLTESLNSPVVDLPSFSISTTI